MLNIGLHDACKQKDVAGASELSESSSGCSTEIGEAATGTGHAVRALESPVLSCLFVESQPHPRAIFSDAFFPVHVLGTSKRVMPVKPCVPEGHGKQQPGTSQPHWSGWSFPAGCSQARISLQEKP